MDSENLNIVESLTINNFLNIKKANIDIKRVTIIMGGQNSGKSTALKLISFFQGIMSESHLEIIKLKEITTIDSSSFCTKGLNLFEKLFPKYMYNTQEFKIEYKIDAFTISITNKKDKSSYSFTFSYSDNLLALYEKIITEYKVKDHLINVIPLVPYNFNKVIKENIYNTSIKDCFKESIYIPSIRVNTNNTFLHKEGHLKDKISISICKKIESMINNIVGGKVVYKGNQFWIIQNGINIEPNHLSLGAKDVLQLLCTLRDTYFYKPRIQVIIEEIELHLFPTNQLDIVNFIGVLVNNTYNNFIISTSSVYILVALNNLILGKDELNNISDTKRIDELNKIIDIDYLINYKDVSAYDIIDGIFVSAMDDENRLISAYVIDEASHKNDRVFTSLLEFDLDAKEEEESEE